MTLRFQTLQQEALANAFISANVRPEQLNMVHLPHGWSLALSVNK